MTLGDGCAARFLKATAASGTVRELHADLMHAVERGGEARDKSDCH